MSRPASTTGERDSADEVLSLVRAAGLPGYKSAERQSNQSAAPDTSDDDRQIHALVRASGLPGYDPDKLAAPQQTAPDRIAATQRASAAATARLTGASTSPTARLSSRQFAVLEIAPGGESALAALETKMGMPFAASYQGQPFWSSAPTPAGGTRRAFTFMGDQLVSFADLLGELGSSALRLSVSGIEVGSFNRAGPGATGRTGSSGEPPQLPPGLPKALRSALGRVQ
jgi:hypothetical protein